MSFYDKLKSVMFGKAESAENSTPLGEPVPRSGEKAVNPEAEETRVGQFGFSSKSQESYNINPDELVKKKGIDVYKQMLMDDQIKANSLLKKTARLSTDNSIEDASNEKQDQIIGDFVRHILYHRMDITMRNLLLSLMSGMDYGFALAEKNWEYIDEGDWAGYVGYKNINPKAPKGFHFDRFDNGTVKPRGLLQNTSLFPWSHLSQKEKDGMPRFRIDKFVHYAHMSEFSNPYGQSDLKSGYRSWLSKDVMMKYWMMYLERHGAPLPMATIPLGATNDEVEACRTMATNLHGKSVVIMPDGFGLGYLESARTASPGFEQAIAIHNGALDRSAMVPQLMGLSGGGGTGGSYGLGKTQYDVFIFYQEFLGLQLEDVFQRQVIKPLVDLNFANVKNYPKFQFASIRRETRKDRAQIVQLLTQSGHINAHEDWIWAFIDLPINKAAIPKAGTPIYTQGGDPSLDLDRGTRTGDPEERSAAEGTDPYAENTEMDESDGE
jgi:hypothetical protein